MLLAFDDKWADARAEFAAANSSASLALAEVGWREALDGRGRGLDEIGRLLGIREASPLGGVPSAAGCWPAAASTIARARR